MLQQQDNDPYAGGAPDPAQAPQPQAQPQARPQGSPYDGMTATNPQTRQRVVYRTGAGGRGQWVEISPENAPAEAREALENERQTLARLRETGRLADVFLEHNQQRGTGGLADQDWFPDWNQPHRQAMEGVSAEMVRSNIRPGTAGTMNSNAEQILVQRQYPNVGTHSNVNVERVVRIRVARDMQVELVGAMEDWLRRNPSLAGFEQEWRRREPVIRDELTRLHAQRFSRVLDERGIYRGENRPQEQRQPQPRQGAAEQWVLDPRTGSYVRRQP